MSRVIAGADYLELLGENLGYEGGLDNLIGNVPEHMEAILHHGSL